MSCLVQLLSLRLYRKHKKANAQVHSQGISRRTNSWHAVFVPRRGACFCFKKKKHLSFPLQLMFLSLLSPPFSPFTSLSLPPLVLQSVPPDLCICNFVLEQSLSVRALQEMLANTGQNSEGVSISLLLLLIESPLLCVSRHKRTHSRTQINL